MKKQENLWVADEGMTIARKSDGFIMGTCIDLGVDDSIYNYKEVELTKENDVEGILERKSMLTKRRTPWKYDI